MAGIASSSSSSSEDLTLQANAENNQEQSASFSTPTDQAMNSLLQKRRCELMYELKRLQHGERPVTGSESRDKVGNFFHRRLHRPETSSGVANVDNVEHHRPEQVVVEVEGLLQRRSVSSVLGSERFRRSLENVVRNHLRAPNQQRRRVTDVPEPPLPPPPPVELFDDNESERVPAQSSVDDPALDTQPAAHQREEPGQQHQDGNVEGFVQSLSHEDLVMEISELVHRQLVSSTLSGTGGFRNRLERLVMRRVDESGADGRAVQEQIMRLPPSNIVRNDFSHLGLQGPDMDDAVSVISATASATIPYVQTNGAVNREISSMKSQIAQLTSLLKKSMDIQIDIQRSIKQEVAAAVNQATGGASAPSTASRVSSRRAIESKCIVCVESDADSVLYRCGHICLCYSCAVRMKGECGTCPVCRAPIHDIVRAYRISHD